MKKEFNDLKEHLQFTFDFDQDTRGSYLYQTAEIESLVEQIIAYHYCSEDLKKMNSFLSLVLSQLNFNSKIKIFLKILEKYIEFKDEYPIIKTSLPNIQSFRNKLAHSRLDTSYEFIQRRQRKIRLISQRDEKIQLLEITEKLVKQKNKEIATLHMKLNKIANKISKGEVGILKPVVKT